MGDDIDFAAPPIGQTDAPVIDRSWNLALTRKGKNMVNLVYGTNSSETINALDGVTNGYDLIYGYGGNDSIYGLGGDDYIVGGTGADALNGGTGSDTASYFTSAAGIVASLAAGEGAGGDAEGDTYASIENLVGSEYA
ncbi:MAG: hypothetical protein WA704_06735, partial [Pseudolabrys sp.]